MPSIQEVKNALKKSTNQLVEALTNFPKRDFNKKPSAGAWSAGDVAEHLWLIDIAIIEKVIQGPLQSTDRGTIEKVDKIKAAFLDFETKFTADLTKPADRAKDKDVIINKIKTSRQNFMDLLDTTNLRQECLGFNHSLFGLMTGIEWVYYTIYHSERHLEQIERIENELNKTATDKR